jgi:hypothetical protein
MRTGGKVFVLGKSLPGTQNGGEILEKKRLEDFLTIVFQEQKAQVKFNSVSLLKKYENSTIFNTY